MLIKSRISWEINVDNFIRKINEYSRTSGFGKLPSYLIMNSRTLKMLKDNSPMDLTWSEDGAFQYHGMNIAISEKLSDYEIDLVG